MNTLIEKLAAIKPQGEGDFAFEIYSGFFDHKLYCSDLLEGLKVLSDKEQEILSSEIYHAIYKENLVGYYVINGKGIQLDDLADKLKNVKTDKKILFQVWSPGFDMHDIIA